jgi:hypothetical protein
VNDPKIWKPATIGGILLGVLTAIPGMDIGCCIWIIGGGMLAAHLYVKEASSAVKLGQGILLGLLSGAIGTLIYAPVQLPIFLNFMKSPEFTKQLQHFIDTFPEMAGNDPKAMMDLASSEGFRAFAAVMFLTLRLSLHCLLAMVGGGLGVAIFEKRSPGNPPPQSWNGEPPESLPPPPPES